MRASQTALSLLFLNATLQAAINLPATLKPITVPPGATAQIQIFLATPQALLSGGAIITLDPKIFGSILAADAYSATGDQVGAANISGTTVDIEFASATAGLGRLPGLPVITVTAAILPTAKPGAISVPKIAPGTKPWTDLSNNSYTLSVVSGAITIGDALSIGSISPNGATVAISGTGFTPSTTAQIDGVPITATQIQSPQQLTLTLATPQDLSGREITVQDPASPSASTFYTLHGPYLARPTAAPLPNIQPIFSFQLYTNASFGCFCIHFDTGAISVQNPTDTPAQITIFGYGIHDPLDPDPVVVTVPPGSTYMSLFYGNDFSEGSNYLFSTSPVRLAAVSTEPCFLSACAATSAISADAPVEFTIPPAKLSINFNGFPDTLVWNVSVGGTPPAPLPIIVESPFPATFTAATRTDTGGSWLSLSAQQGAACIGSSFSFTDTCPSPSKLAASVNVSNLAPGTYTGAVTITPQEANPQALVIPVTLNIFGKPKLLVDTTALLFESYPGEPPTSTSVQLSSTADPQPFITSITTGSGLNWLSVTPSQGQTPALLKLTFTSANAPLTTDLATLTITSPTSTATISVPLWITQAPPPPPPVPAPVVTTKPQSLQFTVVAGQSSPASQTITPDYLFSKFAASMQTSSGGNWLSALKNPVTNDDVIVSVNPSGLAPGTYQGTVSITSPAALQPANVPVTLLVLATPPALTSNPSALSFSTANQPYLSGQTITISSGSIPIRVTVSTPPSDTWLMAYLVDGSPTPTTVYVYPLSGQPAGTYTSAVTITGPNSTNSITVPVTLTVTPSPQPPSVPGTPPLATYLISAASQISGPLSPGEIVTLFGQNLGPAIPAGPILSSPTQVSTANSNVQVLFNDVPAPLLYVSSLQINAVVPYELTGSTVAVRIVYNGISNPAGTFPLQPATPALFTQGLQPATRGSTIQLFATGLGPTIPPNVTGAIAAGASTTLALPASLTIGGVPTQITYAGNAPGQVSGLFQINAQVPLTVTPGDAVPVILTIGSASSPATATMQIK